MGARARGDARARVEVRVQVRAKVRARLAGCWSIEERTVAEQREEPHRYRVV